MKSFKRLNVILILSLSLLNIGCANFGIKLKNFLSGKSSEPAGPVQPQYTKFSEQPNVIPNTRRQYKRVTKETLSDEANLESRSGSLWVMEGQGSYLFSENIIRMIGDPMPVQIDGEPKDQLQSKVNVVRKLLAKLERPTTVRDPASTIDSKAPEAPKAPGAGAAAKADATANKDVKSEVLGGGEGFPVNTVPTRIVERLIDGNYRVRGSQPFMIGPREYQVIVTGIVRAEDFSDNGISSTKLLDPKFDIISVRRKEE